MRIFNHKDDLVRLPTIDLRGGGTIEELSHKSCATCKHDKHPWLIGERNERFVPNPYNENNVCPKCWEITRTTPVLFPYWEEKDV